MLIHILHLAVETAATQAKPADPGLPNPDFWLVRAGGLAFGKPQSVYVCIVANSIR